MTFVAVPVHRLVSKKVTRRKGSERTFKEDSAANAVTVNMPSKDTPPFSLEVAASPECDASGTGVGHFQWRLRKRCQDARPRSPQFR